MPGFSPNDCHQVMSQNRNNQHQHGGHPKKPPGTHNNGPEELAAINQTLIALSKKYDEANKQDASAGSFLLKSGLRLVSEFTR
jgi:hypothetical protein